VRHLQSCDFDVALSHAMKVDHGITIPLFKLTGALDRYDVLPVFINCAADPRPSFRRARAFGSAIGQFLAKQDMKITVVGSGGLSHDPPTPRIDHSKPEATQRLVDRAVPTQADYDAREARVVQAARDLVVGKGPCLPPSEQWDRDFLESFTGSRFEDFDTMSDAEIDRVAGFGAHEVRTWVAAGAAAAKMGGSRAELRYYHLVPEWITGMGIVVGQA
jgi:2,3-dihydroxyphenylpropionate 1,2-dioxygenase